MSELPGSIEKARERRAAIKREHHFPPIDAATRELVIVLLTEGATLSEIVERDEVGSYGAIWEAARIDAAFASALSQARVASASAHLDVAHQFHLDAAQTGDPDKSQIAQRLSAATTAYVEKVAPREFGPLLKMAGHDGGPLRVTVVDYSKSEGEPAIPLIDASLAREGLSQIENRQAASQGDELDS